MSNLNGLSDVEIARWMCLIDAVNIVSAKDSDPKHLKQVPIAKFVKQREPAMLAEVKHFKNTK